MALRPIPVNASGQLLLATRCEKNLQRVERADRRRRAPAFWVGNSLAFLQVIGAIHHHSFPRNHSSDQPKLLAAQLSQPNTMALAPFLGFPGTGAPGDGDSLPPGQMMAVSHQFRRRGGIHSHDPSGALTGRNPPRHRGYVRRREKRRTGWTRHSRVPRPGDSGNQIRKENIGALNVHLTDEQLRHLDEAFPVGMPAGERYPEQGMPTINR